MFNSLLKLFSVGFVIYEAIDYLLVTNDKINNSNYRSMDKISPELNKLIEQDFNDMKKYIKSQNNKINLVIKDKHYCGFDACLEEKYIPFNYIYIELNLFSFVKRETFIKLCSEINTIPEEFRSSVLNFTDEQFKNVQQFIINHELSHYTNKHDKYFNLLTFNLCKVLLIVANLKSSLTLTLISLALIYPSCLIK